MRYTFLIGLLAVVGCTAFADGAADGRQGNRLLAAGVAEGAAAAYQAGVAASTEGDGHLATALLANLGLARYADEAFAEAADAFAEAVERSPDAEARARYAFYAGTARARAEELEPAAALLRQALVARPDFPEARHNYEWVKRRLDTPPPDDTPPEPSAFAQRLKAQADSLVAARQYPDALRVMTEGLQQDSTVAAYADYMQRLGDVVQIETGAPPTARDTTAVDSLR